MSDRLEILLEQVAPDRAQIVSQQIREPGFLLLGEVLRAFEEETSGS